MRACNALNAIVSIRAVAQWLKTVTCITEGRGSKTIFDRLFLIFFLTIILFSTNRYTFRSIYLRKKNCFPSVYFRKRYCYQICCYRQFYSPPNNKPIVIVPVFVKLQKLHSRATRLDKMKLQYHGFCTAETLWHTWRFDNSINVIYLPWVSLTERYDWVYKYTVQ